MKTIRIQTRDSIVLVHTPDVAELVDAVWSEYEGSVKERWTFRKEHIENAIRAALAKYGEMK